MKKHTLSAQKREVVGRKVKHLRSEGLLPATVYGKKVKSISVTVKTEDFAKTYKEAGETGLIELAIDKETRPVLVHNVQADPVTGSLVHAEFFQVDLKEKVHANVPLEFTGEAPAVVQKIGVLLTVMDEVEVEALPGDLPEKIRVDVSKLEAVNQEFKVSDLVIPSGVSVLSDATLTVAKIGTLISREAEAEAAAEAVAAAAAEEEKAAQEAPAETPTAEAPSVTEKPPEETGKKVE